MRELFRRCMVEWLMPLRGHITTVTAFMFVTIAVLLALDSRLPFPSPGERVLYDPSSLSLLFHSATRQRSRPEMAAVPGPAVGGFSMLQPPLTIMYYKAKPGDTIGSIATKLGLNIDTVSSMNRMQGRGVHNVVVGELLKIPSQNGIYLALNGDFDAMCRANGVDSEDVLAANGIDRASLTPGMQLFFPGVQHKGYDLALAEGLGVALPLHGWESSPFGRREDPFTGQPSRHSGVDIAAPMGTPIRSATDGKVIDARFDDMLGNFVMVIGPGGFTYIYGHMRESVVRIGQRVYQGQTLLGYVGVTGYTTGPHLHFEVRKGGILLNPQDYLPPIR